MSPEVSLRRSVAMIAATTLVAAGLVVAGHAGSATAQLAPGDAPFINTWLVSGPHDTAVADENYGTIRPVDGNWAPLADVSASSTWKTEAVAFPSGQDNPNAVASNAVDGQLSTYWASQMHNNAGDPATWPAWDPSPTLTMTWATPIKVKEIQVFDRHDASWPANTSDVQRVDYTLKNAAGTALASGSITSIDPTGANPGLETLQTTVQNVSKIELLIVHNGQKVAKNVGLGFKEVKVLDGDGVITPSAPTNLATSATATASSTWKTTPANFPSGTDNPTTVASKAIDGNLATNWAAQMHNTTGDPSSWPAWDPTPSLTLTWPAPVKVRQIQVFDRHESSWPAGTSDVERVDYSLENAAGSVLTTGSITSIDPKGQNPGVVTLPTSVAGVSKIELRIVYDGAKTAANTGLGFKEVRVFDTALTPQVGDVFEGKTWEYFDDRVWNRNYDDYQDLHGYYGVKKGVDTRNKYVYAASYVYTATAKDVHLRFGSSGTDRAYVNDVFVGGRATPAEVQKDMTSAAVHLDAGWNKILLQFKHTYTDDQNGNGVPIAKDANVAYFGFYARLTDADKNTVDGLHYSVTGGNSALSIDTQELSATDVDDDGSAGRGLPGNVLPAAYREWPYVWNESFSQKQHAVSASHFRFLASGGAPGYTWTLASGSSLPEGLSLNSDGTVDGMVEAAPGTYSFTVKVTDSASVTATKQMSIVVKERPNRWLELGKVSGLTHGVAAYSWFADPNFSADLWAERAKRQGHAMVTIETLQQSYYWPSRFADPAHVKNQYGPKDANGKVPDALTPFADAIERHGMKLGLYYATEGGGQNHYSSDVFVQNVQDLILRYDPTYFYFDGPQAMPFHNYDAMYSIVRNYSDDIIVQSNAWTDEFGDPDLRTGEAGHIFDNAHGMQLVKRTISEPWKIPVTKYNPTWAYPQRDDYRDTTKEMVMNAGRGHIDNADQTPIMGRGPNYDTAATIVSNYPRGAQEYIDMRENAAAWWAPADKPERHESITGTMPYFLANSHYSDDGKGNITNFALGKGPDWGYAMSRDNNIYLHLIQGPDDKNGYVGNVNGFADDELTISPVPDTVERVSWLNAGEDLDFSQNGDTVTIDLSGVERDQIDTIIKLETDDPQRTYPLTHVVAAGEQLTPSTLQVHAEGYRTFTALKAPFGAGAVTYSSSSPGVATVNSSGVVTAGAAGTATISVSGTYDGVTKSDTLDVKVAGGKVYVKDTLIGASLWVADRETFGEFSSYEAVGYRLEGRSQAGGAIGLGAASITMKAGVVDTAGATLNDTMPIDESSTIVTFAGGKVIPEPVTTPTRIAVWGEVTLDGQTVTTNRVFMELLPSRNVAGDAVVAASGSTSGFPADNTVDGDTIAGTRFDASKWSVSGAGASWISFQLAGPTAVQNIELVYNAVDRAYVNTPESMQIQTSVNGTSWTTVSTVTPPAPGAAAHFGVANKYTVNATTRHVRLNFPLGGNGTAPIDVQEVKITGVAAPVLHWKLDETSGTTAADSSGSGRPGTVSGTAAWTTGKLGNALDLDGTTSYVTSATLASTKTDNVTMSAWIKWDGSTGADQIIAYNGNSATSGYGLMLRGSSSNRIQILVGGVGYVTSQVTPTVGEWTLATAVRRSGTWRLFVNGAEATVGNDGAAPNAVTGTTKVGASSINAGLFNGSVDDVKIYESALTDDEIRAAH